MLVLLVFYLFFCFPLTNGYSIKKPTGIRLTLSGKDGVHDGGIYVTWLTMSYSRTFVQVKSRSPFLYEDNLSEIVANYTTIKGRVYRYRHKNGYLSRWIHRVHIRKHILDNFKYNTYEFLCGSEQEWSNVIRFRGPPKPCFNCPVRFGVLGDMGMSHNVVKTVQRLRRKILYSNVNLHVGDLSYANGYQRRWDRWDNYMKILNSHTVFASVPGNHEMEKYNHIGFTPYKNRYPSPSLENHFYYSFNVGSAHVIMLNNYESYKKTSPQYKWLRADLSRINRKVVSWIIVVFHCPWYHTNKKHFGECDNFRVTMEPILFKNKVDITVSGHIHAYERSFPVNNYTISQKGLVHVYCGTGGSPEGLSSGFQTTPNRLTPLSIVRRSDYGFGFLDIKNSTHAYWEWYRNKDKADVPHDRAVIGCSKRTKAQECHSGCEWNKSRCQYIL